MPSLTTPRELPKWVPGKVLSASDALGWKNVGQRTYRYSGLRFTSGARAPHLAGIELPIFAGVSLDYASPFRPAPSTPLPLG